MTDSLQCDGGAPIPAVSSAAPAFAPISSTGTESFRVSVIIPFRNAAAYLTQSLESVAAQSLAPCELLAIDDGSTDGSRDIAAAAARALALPLRLLSCGAGNAAAARNVGIRAAIGNWIAFLDADDYWHQSHLQAAACLLIGTPDVAFMANHLWLRNDCPEPLPADLRPKIDVSRSGISGAEFIELLAKGFHFGHSTVIYRADRVREVGGFDETQVRRHDIDLWLRVVASRTWSWSDRLAASYRVDSAGSISKNVAEAEYYYLRALRRGESSFPGAAMDSLIRTSARRAMSLSFVDGSPDLYARVRPLAWPRLTADFRAGYRLARACPAAFRGSVRLKRRLVRAFANAR